MDMHQMDFNDCSDVKTMHTCLLGVGEASSVGENGGFYM